MTNAYLMCPVVDLVQNLMQLDEGAKTLRLLSSSLKMEEEPASETL
jgi:hypothetical protein